MWMTKDGTDVVEPARGPHRYDRVRALYQYGFDKAKTGDFWAKAPPSDDPLQSGFRYRGLAAQQ
jgi:hypothetical protein